MALIPVLKKNQVTQEQTNELLAERLDAFTKMIRKSGLDAEKSIKRMEEAERRVEKDLSDKKKVATIINKKNADQKIKELNDEVKLFKKELEISNSAEARLSIEKINKQIKKLEKKENIYDKRLEKIDKKQTRKYLWETKGVIGLLNPVAKGILAGGKGVMGAIGSQVKKNKDGFTGALLGPLSLVTTAVEDSFGIDIGEKIGGAIKNRKKGSSKKDSYRSSSRSPFRKKEIPDDFDDEPSQSHSFVPEAINNLLPDPEAKKIVKTKPTLKDVAKIGDMGSLLLYHLIKGKKGKNDEEKKGGFFSNLLSTAFGGGLKDLGKKLLPLIGGFFGKLFEVIFKGNLFQNIGNLLAKKFPSLFGKEFANFLGKAGPKAMIISGLIMMVIDGIKGMLAGWKTSKISGFIGGFLGGADKGIKGAFKNMGKWALIGAGVGSFVPVVGTVLGGLIGAVVGGIIGFIGGERIAKALDAIGGFAYKWIITPIGKFFSFIGSFIYDHIISPIGNFIVNAGKWFYKFFMIGEMIEGIKGIGKKVGLFLYKVVIKNIVKMGGLIGSFLFNNMIVPVGKFFTRAISGISNAFLSIGTWISTYVLSPLGGFFTRAWGGIKNVAKWAETVLFTPLGKFIGDIFNKVTTTVPDLFNKYILTPIQDSFSFLSNIFGFIFSGKINIGDLIGSLFNDKKKADLTSNFTSYVTDKQKEREAASGAKASINDGIVRSDGSFVRISPDDNVYATKKDLSSTNINNNSKSTISIDRILEKLDEIREAIISSSKIIVAPSSGNEINLDIFKV